MIFVTVGTQLPFDRLVKSVNSWAKDAGNSNVFAQTGETDYQPSHISCMKYLGVKEFDQRVAEADLLISHAGMGSIITAMEMSKPIVVLPRLARFGEHRNDHQLATVSRFSKLSNVFVSETEDELAVTIEQALSASTIAANSTNDSRVALVSSISRFIEQPTEAISLSA